ncbi:MAG: EAL domain-containing protein [Tagaea sp.]|nr:EAL domain-containing protein [Tagaea sp.]
MAAEKDIDAAISALLGAGDAAYVWDLASDRIVWAGRPDETFGPRAEFPPTGQIWQSRIHAEDLPGRVKALSAHFVDRLTYDLDYRLRGDSGGMIWAHDRGRAEFAPDGKPIRVAGTLRAVTARKDREAKLEYLANYDALTGHFNAARLRESLDHALAYAARYEAPGAYLLIGVDNLTAINDAFGWSTADALLIGVGQRLERALRGSDTIGRAGGDRFGLVLANCPESEIGLAAERLLATIRSAPLETPDGPLHVTASAGAVLFVGQGPSGVEIQARAESALHEAKRAGRNRYALFAASPAQRELHQRLVSVSSDVQAALKDERLVFAFQPVVDAIDHTVKHYEALLRLQRMDGTIAPAGSFIPIVEQTGLMRLLDRRVLEMAIGELTRWNDIVLAINISGLTAGDPSWLRALSGFVKGRPDLAQRLIVEITETVAIRDIDETAKFVAAVRDLGARVALDDFGAGYTSFRNLKALAIDSVKIDGSFVRGLADNVDNQLFIKTLLGLAEGFGLETVAECVENPLEAQHLARRGVKLLQGNMFGLPRIDRPWLDDLGLDKLSAAPRRPAFAVIPGKG